MHLGESADVDFCRLIVSTEPLQENPGDIMLTPETVEFAWSALADSGGHRTEEIQFSGKSARVARRLSRPTTDQVCLPNSLPILDKTALYLACGTLYVVSPGCIDLGFK